MENGSGQKPAPVFADVSVSKKSSLHPVLRAGTGESGVAVLMSGNLAGIALPGGSLADLRCGGAALFKGVRRYIAGAIALAERLSERWRCGAHRNQHSDKGKLWLIDHGNSPRDAADDGVTPVPLLRRKWAWCGRFLIGERSNTLSMKGE
jgi:hypothetical protein